MRELFDRRGDAVKALGVLGSRAAIDALMELADGDFGPSPRGRLKGTLSGALRGLRRPNACSEHRQALAGISDQQQRFFVTALLTDDADPELLPLIQGELACVRAGEAYNEAISRLAEMNQVEAIEILLRNAPDLDDENTWRAYVLCLATNGTTRATARLLEQLQLDKPVWLRRAAAMALDQCRDSRRLDQIGPMLDREKDEIVRGRLRQGLCPVKWCKRLGVSVA